MLVINRRIRIPLREFDFQFARSGGAGGQNVNKVNTKAILRWEVERSPALPGDVRERFCARFRRRILFSRRIQPLEQTCPRIFDPSASQLRSLRGSQSSSVR